MGLFTAKAAAPAAREGVVSSMLHPQAMASEYLSRALKQASVSLTLGVFLGAALTTGAAFGLAAAYFANDRVIQKLRKAAVTVVTTARDAALSTREGRALSNAVLKHAPVPFSPAAGKSSSSDSVSSSSSSSPDTSAAAQMGVALRSNERLPEVAPPGGHYKPYSLCGPFVYLSGYTSRNTDGTPITGTVVSDWVVQELNRIWAHRVTGVCLSAHEGAEAARTCALGHLAILESCCGGLGNVRRVHKVTCFVNSTNLQFDETMVKKCGDKILREGSFKDSPLVANGYSDLLMHPAVLGEERGAHARSAVCVSGLPGGAAVEIEAVVELFDPTLCGV